MSLRRHWGRVASVGWLVGATALALNFSKAGSKAAFDRIQVDKLIVMPDASGHVDWIQAIQSAHSSVHMTMYHLTDKAVIDALVSKASDKSVDVRVIVDGKSLKGGYKAAADAMIAAGVQLRPSSPSFSITHSKDLVIDGQMAIIGAINMTNTSGNSRDFGILTHDQSIILEIERVFETDWLNAQNKTGNTPTVSNPNLAWSPNNSEAQLLKLINVANASLDLEVENLGQDDVISALNSAAGRGVNVRVIVPECALGDPMYNYKGITKLHGIGVHVEHNGNSIDQPYMHSKLIVVDSKYVYVGSINFSINSLEKARELGVIFEDETTASQLTSDYEIDWNRSQPPADHPACGKYKSDGGNAIPEA